MPRQQDVFARFGYSSNSSLKVFDNLYAEVTQTVVDGPKHMVGRTVRTLFTAEEARRAAKQLLAAADNVDRHNAEDAERKAK